MIGYSDCDIRYVTHKSIRRTTHNVMLSLSGILLFIDDNDGSIGSGSIRAIVSSFERTSEFLNYSFVSIFLFIFDFFFPFCEIVGSLFWNAFFGLFSRFHDEYFIIRFFDCRTARNVIHIRYIVCEF